MLGFLYAVPILSAQHRRDRLHFALEHRHWQLRHWRTVLFTDESRFHLSTCGPRVRVWRQPGERYSACNVVQYDRFGGGSVMVWGGICLDSRTDLYVVHGGSLTAARYCNEILLPIVRPFAGAVGENFLLMHDNARPHTARQTQELLETECIEAMDWPSRSPDLNPIEHCWDLLSRRIRRRIPPPTNVRELTDALLMEWQALPQNNLRRLIRSISRRCEECVHRRGGHTHY